MKHAVFVEPGKVEWRETADAVLQGDGEAIIMPLVVGRCDLDVAYVKGIMPMPSGAPIGHEIIGEIVDAGDDAGRWQIGQRVFVSAQISCGDCKNCRRGLTGRCLNVPFGASYGMGREGGFGGGLADLVRVPFARAMLTSVPDGVDPASLIGLADMGADSWRTVAEELEKHPEARVLVLGGMPPVIGLYAAGIATALKAEVTYVDGNTERRQIATRYGAKATASIQDIPANQFDIVVVANPAGDCLTTAFDRIAPGGLITSVTPTLQTIDAIDTRSLYNRGIRWAIGRPDCRHCHDGIMNVWANQGFCPNQVPTTQVPWDDAPEAWSMDALYVAAIRR